MLGRPSIFLAGTIDMGNSENWQKKFIETLENINDGTDWVIFNPRRDEGFGSNQEEFDYQVNWELDHLEESGMIVMNILGNSKSPITLLELGLYARSGKLAVICEPDFYRYGNVRVVCEKYHIHLYNSMEDFLTGNYQ